jgi:hypothetical protein
MAKDGWSRSPRQPSFLNTKHTKGEKDTKDPALLYEAAKSLFEKHNVEVH